MEAKQREIKYELLRILAMGMIITLHYLGKGGFLKPLTEDISVTDGLAWLLEAFCLVAVNVYVLISGYFGCMSEWRIKKLVTLWLQVFFYAFVIGVFVLLTGVADRSAFSLYDGIKLICPITTEHYWFATSYLLLFLMIPFLKAGIEKLTKQELGVVIIVMLLIHSVMKSILPMHLPWDKLGYDAWWFVTLFLIGAYLRKYGMAVLRKKKNGILLYLLFSVMTFALTMGIHLVYKRTGSLAEFVSYAYAYNHVFCLIASVGLFGMVMCAKEIAWKPQTGRWIMKISGATFGVYLLHEHIYVRYQWPVWLGAERFHGTPVFLLHLLVSVIIVYVTGTAVELARQRIFALVKGRR